MQIKLFYDARLVLPITVIKKKKTQSHTFDRLALCGEFIFISTMEKVPFIKDTYAESYTG